MEDQPELPLPPPPLRPDQPYLPARMVNEFQYCPRLAYLEWVQGEWAESADTVEGRGVHRRLDRGPGALPEPDDIGDDERIHVRSVTLSSDRLGLIAKLDLVEAEDGAVQPVDYKRGRRPHVPAGAWEPELVQLCVQGLILEDNGYRCSEGALYFRESRERVRVRFDEALRSKALAAVHGLRLVAAGGRIPPPLEDSPKCPRCSLVGICLPDEVNYFRHGTAPRPLAVDRELALPVYIQANPPAGAQARRNIGDPDRGRPGENGAAD
jgi:CRISPR-associated protein Cas1